MKKSNRNEWQLIQRAAMTLRLEKNLVQRTMLTLTLTSSLDSTLCRPIIKLAALKRLTLITFALFPLLLF
jgi:hypothetical protein